MALFYDEPKKNNWTWVLSLILIAILIVFSNYEEWELRYKTAKTKTRPAPTNVVGKKYLVSKGDEKNHELKSRLFQHLFHQDGRTAGRSADELLIQFDQPALLYGILISVDCWKSTRLVEFAAGINQQPAYQANTQSAMLFHVSFATNHQAGKIDEQFWYPVPFFLNPGDSINIGSWIQNISSKTKSVSPEMIFYFKWVEEDEKKAKKIALSGI